MDPTPHLLSELPFFRDFNRESLRLLSASAMHVRLEPGVEIFREGEPADRFYVLRSGRIAIETRGPDGQPMVVQVLGAGELVGWSWLLEELTLVTLFAVRSCTTRLVEVGRPPEVLTRDDFVIPRRC